MFGGVKPGLVQCAGRLAEMQRILRQLMMNKRRLYVNKRTQVRWGHEQHGTL